MSLRTFFESLTSTRRRPTRRRPPAPRLSLEPLEDRCLLSTYLVLELGLETAADINNHGQIAGSGSTFSHAALWQNGTAIDLGVLGLGAYSGATAISDAGHVVGYSSLSGYPGPSSPERHAFLLTPEDTDQDGVPDRWFRDSNSDGANDLMTDLGTLGRAESLARDVNAFGQVVGETYGAGPSDSRAFIWNNGVMTDLGTLGGPMSRAYAINDAGQVVGEAYDASGQTYGFLINPEDTNADGAPDRWYRDTNGDGANDLMVVLPNITNTSDVNAGGQVVGDGFLWTPDTPNGTTGSLTYLSDVSPIAINGSAQVAGEIGWGNSEGGGSVAALWEDGVAVDLNTRVPAGGATLTTTQAINDHGWILASTESLWNGRYNAPFLLTPSDLPTISIGDATVTEGSTASADFAVTLSHAYGEPVTIDYATIDGSAVAGSDYQATSGTLTFAPGETAKTIRVAIIDDRLAEYAEGFRVRLGNPTNAILTYETYYEGTGTIIDNEPTLRIVDSVWVTEGQTGTTPATFTVRLSAPSDAPVTVNYRTSDGDAQNWWDAYPPPAATAGSDYQAQSGTLTFAPGETTKTITVLVNGDRVYEGGDREVFSVDLGGATGATVVQGHGVGSIIDDDPLISVSDATGAEGNTGTNAFVFTVSLSRAYDEPVTVNYATADVTAKSGSDYQATSGVLTFAPGQVSQTITVQVTGDRVGEPDEYFYVNLSNASAGAITGSGVGLIRDDEPRISISDVSAFEGKRGQTTLLTFTVTLSAAYDQAVTLSFRTVNGTANAGQGDYVAQSGTLTFAPGETTKTITIVVNGDSKKEADETFYLDLFGNSGNALFTRNRGTGLILNDD